MVGWQWSVGRSVGCHQHYRHWCVCVCGCVNVVQCKKSISYSSEFLFNKKKKSFIVRIFYFFFLSILSIITSFYFYRSLYILMSVLVVHRSLWLSYVCVYALLSIFLRGLKKTPFQNHHHTDILLLSILKLTCVRFLLIVKWFFFFLSLLPCSTQFLFLYM